MSPSPLDSENAAFTIAPEALAAASISLPGVLKRGVALRTRGVVRRLCRPPLVGVLAARGVPYGDPPLDRPPDKMARGDESWATRSTTLEFLKLFKLLSIIPRTVFRFFPEGLALNDVMVVVHEMQTGRST